MWVATFASTVRSSASGTTSMQRFARIDDAVDGYGSPVGKCPGKRRGDIEAAQAGRRGGAALLIFGDLRLDVRQFFESRLRRSRPAAGSAGPISLDLPRAWARAAMCLPRPPSSSARWRFSVVTRCIGTSPGRKANRLRSAPRNQLQRLLDRVQLHREPFDLIASCAFLDSSCPSCRKAPTAAVKSRCSPL